MEDLRTVTTTSPTTTATPTISTVTTVPTTTTIPTNVTPYLPPCRVCSGTAGGLHYGVNTCQGCKGFYRRGIARKEPYAACCNQGRCTIEYTNRNDCPMCRFKKCLQVGMSKSAIKTGRYTVEKRTRDTIEVQRSLSSTSMASLDNNTATGDTRADILGSASFSIGLQHGLAHSSSGSSNPVTLSTSPTTIDPAIEKTLKLVTDAFRNSFHDTAYMFDEPAKIDSAISSVMKEESLDRITDLVVQTGATSSPEQRDHFEKLLMQAQTITSIQEMNNSFPEQQLLELESFKEATGKLFEIWSVNMEKLVRELIQFAKNFPVFRHLNVDDQIVLIKCARSEITTLVKYKHFKHSPNAYVDYRRDSGTICIIPTATIRLFFHGETGTKSDYVILFGRMMMALSKLDPCIESVALMCAVALFSADHEGLSEESKQPVADLQDKLTTALAYYLEKSHPKGKSLLPSFLMLLPTLRELSLHNTKSLKRIRKRFKPSLSPLLLEVLPASN